MKNDGYVIMTDVMPYLLENLAYWSGEDVYKALEKMPIVSVITKNQLKTRFIKKSNIMFFLTKYLVYWGREDVEHLLSKMPTIRGILVKIHLNKE